MSKRFVLIGAFTIIIVILFIFINTYHIEYRYENCRATINSTESGFCIGLTRKFANEKIADFLNVPGSGKDCKVIDAGTMCRGFKIKFQSSVKK